MAGKWTEIGDSVFVRRYRFFDQNIVAIVGRGETLIVDTRSSHRQAAELQADLRELGAPPVTVVVSTHGHADHVFGNHAFRRCIIWGHDCCLMMIQSTGELQRAALSANQPELADELAEVVLDPPDNTFAGRASSAPATCSRMAPRRTSATGFRWIGRQLPTRSSD